jgi:hypothetical protein
VATEKQDARLWRLLARACEEKGEYREALGYLTEALRVQPDDVASLSLLAQLHERRHAESDAVRCHQQVLVQDPTRKTSNRFLAHYHYSRGEYEQALMYFTQLLEAEPQARINKLYCVLTRVKMSGIRGVAKFLTEVHGWRELSPEERVLMHELFVVVGGRCLQNQQIVRATQYLTWAVELVSTPEAQALLADAIAQDPWATTNAETTASTARPAGLGTEHFVWPQEPSWRSFFLRPIAITVGAVAVAVVLGFFLFSDQPSSFLAQPEEQFVSSAFVPRPSLTEFGESTSAPMGQFQELTPSTDERVPQAETSIRAPKVQTQERISPNKGSKKSKSDPLVGATIAKPVPLLLPNPVTSHLGRRSEKQGGEKTAALSAPLEAAKSPQVGVDTVVPKSTQLTEVREQESLPLANTPTPENFDTTQPVTTAAIVPPSPAQAESNEEKEEEREVSSDALFTEGAESVIDSLAAQLPFAKQFPIREREFALSPEQLWPRLKALVEEETEVLLREDRNQGLLHGMIVQRRLRPRLHTFKPYGHYLVEVVPGAREGTSLVRAKVLTFDWRTKRPTPRAEQQADRFLQQIAGIIQ